MANESELKDIKDLCILNFLELQEIKQQLRTNPPTGRTFYDYANALEVSLREMDNRIIELLKYRAQVAGNTKS